MKPEEATAPSPGWGAAAHGPDAGLQDNPVKSHFCEIGHRCSGPPLHLLATTPLFHFAERELVACGELQTPRLSTH